MPTVIATACIFLVHFSAAFPLHFCGAILLHEADQLRQSEHFHLRAFPTKTCSSLCPTKVGGSTVAACLVFALLMFFNPFLTFLALAAASAFHLAASESLNGYSAPWLAFAVAR